MQLNFNVIKYEVEKILDDKNPILRSRIDTYTRKWSVKLSANEV